MFLKGTLLKERQKVKKRDNENINFTIKMCQMKMQDNLRLFFCFADKEGFNNIKFPRDLEKEAAELLKK